MIQVKFVNLPTNIHRQLVERTCFLEVLHGYTLATTVLPHSSRFTGQNLGEVANIQVLSCASSFFQFVITVWAFEQSFSSPVHYLYHWISFGIGFGERFHL